MGHRQCSVGRPLVCAHGPSFTQRVAARFIHLVGSIRLLPSRLAPVTAQGVGRNRRNRRLLLTATLTRDHGSGDQGRGGDID